MKKLEAVRNHLEIAVSSCFIASILFYCSEHFFAHVSFYGNDPVWFFMIQALTGIIAIMVPYKLRMENKLKLSPLLYCCYLIFLFASLFLGELCHFYTLIPSWDSLLHFSSGFLLFFVALEWLQKTVLQRRAPEIFSLLFLSLCISLAIGGIWEIYEFMSDFIFHTNMQRFLSMNGESLIGRSALIDTMSDLIFGLLGTILGIACYVYEHKYKTRESVQELKVLDTFLEGDEF